MFESVQQQQRSWRRTTWYGVMLSALVLIAKLVLVMLRRDPARADLASPPPVAAPIVAPTPSLPRSELLGFSVASREPMSPVGSYALGHAAGKDDHEVVNWRTGTLADRAMMLTRSLDPGVERREETITIGGHPGVRITTKLSKIEIAYVECDGRLVELVTDLGEVGHAWIESFACTPVAHARPTRLAFDLPAGWSRTPGDDGDVFSGPRGTMVRSSTIVAPDLAIRTAVGQYLDGTQINLGEAHLEGDRTVFAMQITTDDGKEPGEVVAWRCTDRDVALVWLHGPEHAAARRLVASGRCM